MTYNFDPERWYQNEREALDSAHQAGAMTFREFLRALDALDERFASMLDRLDRTYQIPACAQDDF